MYSTNVETGRSSKPFPKLMIGTTTDAIALMSTATQGTVLHVGTSPYVKGEQLPNVLPYTIVDYNKPLTLQND